MHKFAKIVELPDTQVLFTVESGEEDIDNYSLKASFLLFDGSVRGSVSLGSSKGWDEDYVLGLLEEVDEKVAGLLVDEVRSGMQPTEEV